MNRANELQLISRVDGLEKTIMDIKTSNEANTRCINGYAGQPGLYQLIGQVDSKLDNVIKLMNNDFSHLSARVDSAITSLENQSKEAQTFQKENSQKDDEIRKLQSKDIVTWQQVMLEWIKPVVIAIVTAALVYLIVTQNLAVK